MGERTRKLEPLRDDEPVALGRLIHEHVRQAVEQLVQAELAVALGALRHQRTDERGGYRNGTRTRTLTAQSGPFTMEVPRGVLVDGEGRKEEWRSKMLPRYQRRLPEINEAIASVYLSGANTRRLKGAFRPLLRAAPLSRSAVSRVVQTLKGALDAWRERRLEDLDVAYVYLDAIALRVRQAARVVSAPVLVAVAVLTDGSKQLLSLEMCGSESREAWKGFLDDLVARGLRVPRLAVVDGNPGLRTALDLVWSKVPVQRCAVHKLRNLESKAPKHALDEIKADYHRIVYAESETAARAAYKAFVAKWNKTCPAVVRSLDEAADELLTFYRFPRSQWKTLRTTNVIERLNGEFRRRVKTQASLPTEDAALVLLFSLVASGQIRLRKIDGWEDIAHVLSEQVRLMEQKAAKAA
jgi:transposase-like protein